MKRIDTDEQFLAEMESMFGPPQDFRPTATYIAEGDCIEFFARPGSYYAKRLDDLVTVYLSRANDEVVGSLIKGVSSFCRDVLKRFPQFGIVIDGGKVRLEHLFLARLMTEDPAHEPDAAPAYKELIDAAHEANAEAELCAVA
jgi:hypothetical protein